MIIHRYSREDAIRDGVLIDITDTAKELFKFPVAVTKTVWDAYIKNNDGRLWDTLWMLYIAIKQNKSQTNTIHYKLYYGKKLVKLKAIISPGDTPESVITIMLPEED